MATFVLVSLACLERSQLSGLADVMHVIVICYACGCNMLTEVFCMSGKSKLEYMQRHEQISTYQCITFSGGRHGSVIVDIVLSE